MFCTLIPRRSPTRTDNALLFLDFEVKDKTDSELMAEIATACRVHAAAVAATKRAMHGPCSPTHGANRRCLRRSGSARLDIDLWRGMDRCVPRRPFDRRRAALTGSPRPFLFLANPYSCPIARAESPHRLPRTGGQLPTVEGRRPARRAASSSEQTILASSNRWGVAGLRLVNASSWGYRRQVPRLAAHKLKIATMMMTTSNAVVRSSAVPGQVSGWSNLMGEPLAPPSTTNATNCSHGS